MKPALILYATREGHTRRIAQHLGAVLRLRGLDAHIYDAAHLPETFDLASYGAAILAASVHVGKHEREMVAFVKEQLATLKTLPTAFLSVSMSEVAAEDPKRPDSQRTEAANDVREVIEKFLDETHWQPEKIKAVAGALLYTHYGIVTRFIMKMISKRAGGPTDTSRDYEFTDWGALDRFAEDFADELSRPPATSEARVTGAGP